MAAEHSDSIAGELLLLFVCFCFINALTIRSQTLNDVAVPVGCGRFVVKATLGDAALQHAASAVPRVDEEHRKKILEVPSARRGRACVR